MPSYINYSPAELDTLKALYAEHGPRHVAAVLDRTEQSVKMKAGRLGIYYERPALTSEKARQMARTRHGTISPQLEATLRELWPHHIMRDIAAHERVKMSVHTIWRYGRVLGLGRPGTEIPRGIRQEYVPVPRVRKEKPLKEVLPPAPKPAKVAKPAPDYRTTIKTPQGKKPTMRRAEDDRKRPWQMPKNSPEYQAWLAPKIAGRPVSGIDSMNRPTTRYVRH